MEVVLILLGALFAVGLPLWWLDRKNPAPAGGESVSVENNSSGEAEKKENGDINDPEECCGMHVTCERDSLLASVSKEIEYYDDEELDVYRGRDPKSYSDEEVEQFRDILLTLLPHDIAGWARSIQLRGIILPTEVRDELLLIVAEQRQKM